MTTDEKRTEITKIVADFTRQYIERRLLWQLGQIIPGADSSPDVRAALVALYNDDTEGLQHTMEPQEWKTMAWYGAGVIEADPGEMYEICQSMAKWLFSLPTYNSYDIPDYWADTPMGALWWSAIVRCQGDELITLTIEGWTPETLEVKPHPAAKQPKKHIKVA